MIDSKSLFQFVDSQGWSFYGIAPYAEVQKALDRHRAVFEDWVHKGYHAGMDYLSRMAEDRYDPPRKLPNVQSVVVLGAIYSNGGSNCGPNGGADCGIVARYARGRDYHKVLRKKLIELSDWLKSQSASASRKCETYISVDSGPMADRVLAEVAGLGFFGKNSCLIHPSKGSFFFIASLLTTLKLDSTAKKPMPNCGDCTQCQKACPTGALKGGGVIDANRCVSYLTIENKGPIPVDLRPKIGHRLFGCDACQEVCPFNLGRAHHQSVLMANLKPEHGVGESLDLADILSIRTDEEFLRRFAGTPLMRAKRFGLLRNACVVAGNSGNASLIPILNQLIENESDGILKEHAQWALLQLSKPYGQVSITFRPKSVRGRASRVPR